MIKKTLSMIALFSLLLMFGFGTVNAQASSQPDGCIKNGGTYVPNGEFEKTLTCPPRIENLQFIILRLFGILNVLIGLFVLLGLVRAGFLFVLSQGDPEKTAGAVKSLRMAILGFIGISLAYVLLITIGALLITGPNSPSFFANVGQSNTLIFDFLQFQSRP